MASSCVYVSRRRSRNRKLYGADHIIVQTLIGPAESRASTGSDRSFESPSQEFTNVLIKTAIDLHDRQVDAASWWKHMMPLWTALIAAFVVIASSLLTLRFSHPSASGRFVRVGEPYPDSVLLDTATGRYCYSDILGQKNSFNFPTCREPR